MADKRTTILFLVYLFTAFSIAVFYEWPRPQSIPNPNLPENAAPVVQVLSLMAGAVGSAADEIGRGAEFVSVLGLLSLVYFIILNILLRSGWIKFLLRLSLAFILLVVAGFVLWDLLDVAGFYFTPMLVIIGIVFYVSWSDDCFGIGTQSNGDPVVNVSQTV